MDCRKLALTFGLDEVEFKEVVKLFIESSAAHWRDLNSAIESGDAVKAFAASHSIKGASINLGLADISSLARRIEMKARQNTLEGASEAAVLLKQKIDRLADRIEPDTTTD
jgi:HPt (histidine-containing phosphotransfer) domain-containing protein